MIKRRNKEFIGENTAPPKEKLPKKPTGKIKIEAIKEMAKAFNEYINDRSLKAYNPIAKKIEQINKGNSTICQIPSKCKINSKSIIDLAEKVKI